MLKQPSAVLVPDFCLCQHSSSDRLTSRVVFFVAVKILSLCLSSRCRPGRQRPFFLITRYSSTWLPVRPVMLARPDIVSLFSPSVIPSSSLTTMFNYVYYIQLPRLPKVSQHLDCCLTLLQCSSLASSCSASSLCGRTCLLVL